MSQNRNAWFYWLVSILIAGGGGAYLLRDQIPGSEKVFFWTSKKDPEANKYRTEKVSRKNISKQVQAAGQLMPILNVEVGSEVSGIIDEIFVDFNSKVKKGDKLAQINSEVTRAQLTSAEAEMLNSEARLKLAQVEAKRAEELLNEKLIPQNEYEKTQAELTQAQATAKIRQAQYEKAQTDLKKTTIVAPIDGTIMSRVVTMGQTVAASFNSPKLFNIVNDLTKMEIHVSVSEVDIGEVKEGQKATFLVDAFPNDVFEGEVVQVRNDPVTSSNVVNYIVVLLTSNEDLRLKPGMTANAYIVLDERKNVLSIPNTTLRFQAPKDALVQALPKDLGSASEEGDRERPRRASGGGDRPRREGGGGGDRPRRPRTGGLATEGTVYVMGEDVKTAKPMLIERKVKLGLDDGKSTEITEGLEEDEVIVVGLEQVISTPEAANAQSRSGFPGGGFPGGGFPGGGFPGGGRR